MILRFTLRNLSKRPFLNLIKIIGLSLALSGLLIIILFLWNELSYDSSHSKSDRIYRYTFTSESFFGNKHFARVYNASYIPDMAEYFPEISSYVRLVPIRGGFVKDNEKYIAINEAFECDSTFLEIFDCELLIGDKESILNDPGSVILSESFAKRVYGDINPIGKVIGLPKGQYYNDDIEFTVKGIMKDFKQNNHFHPDFITTPIEKTIFNGWAWTYLLLSENARPEDIEAKFIDFVASTSDTNRSEIKMQAHLQAITDIHLHSNKLREIEPNGNMVVIYTLAIAAFLLLFIALINYSNLNIGMAIFSDKFLYINKISGATNWISLKYALYEGILITIVSLLVSGSIIGISNNYIQHYFGLDLISGNFSIIVTTVFAFVVLSLLSGISPLIGQALRRVNSVLNFRSQKGVTRKGVNKSLIILQYTISIALIVAVITIHRQTNYALRSSLGLSTNNLICFERVHSEVQSKFQVFKDELQKYNSIESVSAMFEPPGGEANDIFQFEMEGYVFDDPEKPDNYIGVFPCDYSFASIFNLNFLSGHNFSETYEDNEGSGEYIINEAAMKRLHYSSPDDIVGKDFNLIFNFGNIVIPKGKIIGVVKDFHFSSLKKEVEPLVLFKRKDLWISNFIVSFNTENKQQALKDIEQVWNKLFPQHPFQYDYVNTMYRSVYKTELLQTKLLSIFTFVALFICSIGLLGMSLLVTQRKTKEIGIRKVHGAKISQIAFMLNWSLIKWIIISFIFSIPLAYYAMSRWLENFAYKVTIAWWIFVLSGLIAIVISLLTVSIISWNASRRNPVEALRYE